MSAHTIRATADLLSDTFLLHYPAKAGKQLSQMPPAEAAEVLAAHSASASAAILARMAAGSAAPFLQCWSIDYAAQVLQMMEPGSAVAVLQQFDSDTLAPLRDGLRQANPVLARELEELMSYPANSAGYMMDTRIQVFGQRLSAEAVMQQLRLRRPHRFNTLFSMDDDGRITGQVELSALVLAEPKTRLQKLIKPIRTAVSALDPKEEVIDLFEHQRLNALPVVDANAQVIGVIRNADVLQDTKEELTSDMASMVGASKDEKALSSSWFAVQKRMPWLQINLLTAFLAAGVVGAFEDLIAQFTALAILLPVAAGQSGNAGAQALAVTMRGLTLREITLRHWWRVFRKESAVGFMNGIAVAITCALGVWWWSGSWGLALVMILAMILSLTIACGAGALVPMALKKAGLDPAQSSSIVLTTITDIAGFMSFLGIALLLSGFLPAG